MKENRNIRYIIGNKEILDKIEYQKSFSIFETKTVAFLRDWSKNIRDNENARKYSEVMSFAFFIREANVLQMKKDYMEVQDNRGLGMNLTFASSNIPLMFAYSMSASLIAGNTVMVRLPQELFPQDEMVISELRKTIDEHSDWKDRIILMQYGHDREINDYLSGLCDSRVVWGGDNAIAQITKSPLKDSAAEVLFGDRKSLCIMDATEVAEMNDLDNLLAGFYNDTFLNDQNACSSPSLVFWIGENKTVEVARKKFWDGLSRITENRYVLADDMSVKKLEMAMVFSTVFPGTRIERKTNRIFIIKNNRLDSRVWDYVAPAGYFVEMCNTSWDAIKPLISEKVQTMTVFGKKALAAGECIMLGDVTGITRVAEIGHALDFSLVWDGVDLVKMLSKKA